MTSILELSKLPPCKPHPRIWTGGPRHGTQLRGDFRKRTIDLLIEYDGAYCRADKCYLNRDFGTAQVLEGKNQDFRYKIFTVNHLDGATAHWFDKESLAHWICNNKEDKQHRGKRHSSRRVCESVRVQKPRTPMPTKRDGYSAVKNAEAEPFFRWWVFEYLLKHRLNPPTSDFLVDNGAALVGANPVTVLRWLGKMTAELFGCLDETGKNDAGQTIVQLREAGDYELTAQQICEKYPWAGMRFKPRLSAVETAKAQKVAPEGGQ